MRRVTFALLLLASLSVRTSAQSSATSPDTDRRPAMPGAIDDSSIGTRVAVRVDSGTGLVAPDRAEFITAKCGCYQTYAPASAKYDPSAPGPGPGIVNNARIQQVHFVVEYAPSSDRFSLVADVPMRSFSPQSFVAGSGTVADATGVGDIRFGAKYSLSSHAVTQATVQVIASAPTGDAAKGLGVHHWTVEPTILYAVRLGHRASIESQWGSVFPFNGSAGVPTSSTDTFSGRMILYSAGPSVDVYHSTSTRIAPVVELRGWHILEGYSTGESGPANGLDVVDMTAGVRAVFGRHVVYAGFEKAITNVKWFDRTVRLEYRWGL